MKESVLWPILQQAREYATSTIDDGTNFDVDKFHNKFAELIVEECAEVGFDSVEDGDDGDAIMKRVHDNILKHFGVIPW